MHMGFAKNMEKTEKIGKLVDGKPSIMDATF